MERKTHLGDEKCFFDTCPYVVVQALNKDADSLANEAVKLRGRLCMIFWGKKNFRFDITGLWVVGEWEEMGYAYILGVAITV